jgi:hypothetical protein
MGFKNFKLSQSNYMSKATTTTIKTPPPPTTITTAAAVKTLRKMVCYITVFLANNSSN